MWHLANALKASLLVTSRTCGLAELPPWPSLLIIVVCWESHDLLFYVFLCKHVSWLSLQPSVHLVGGSRSWERKAASLVLSRVCCAWGAGPHMLGRVCALFPPVLCPSFPLKMEIQSFGPLKCWSVSDENFHFSSNVSTCSEGWSEIFLLHQFPQSPPIWIYWLILLHFIALHRYWFFFFKQIEGLSQPCLWHTYAFSFPLLKLQQRT